MKRRTTTVVLVAALALLAAAVGGFTRGTASAGTAASARADATTLTVWVGLERPRAERVQEGRRRVRRQEPERGR